MKRSSGSQQVSGAWACRRLDLARTPRAPPHVQLLRV